MICSVTNNPREENSPVQLPGKIKTHCTFCKVSVKICQCVQLLLLSQERCVTTVEGCKQFRQRQMTGKVSLWSPQREAGRTQRHFYAVKSFKSPGSRTRALSHPPKRRVALESFPPSPGPAGMGEALSRVLDRGLGRTPVWVKDRGARPCL